MGTSVWRHVQADAESVARTVVVFEEVDNLADEDRGFLAALSALVAESKASMHALWKSQLGAVQVARCVYS